MPNKFQEYKDKITDALFDEKTPWKNVLDIAEQKTGIPRIYIFYGCVTFVALYLVFGCGAQLVCNIIGVAYPAYVSIHAIESSPKSDDTRWLIYWVTYAVLSLVEYFSGFLCQFIPFYWLIKCVFLIWCMLPVENNGSAVIYHRIVRPHFLKHHQETETEKELDYNPIKEIDTNAPKKQLDQDTIPSHLKSYGDDNSLSSPQLNYSYYASIIGNKKTNPLLNKKELNVYAQSRLQLPSTIGSNLVSYKYCVPQAQRCSNQFRSRY